MGKIKFLFCLLIIFIVASCQKKEETHHLRIIASPTPHTEMLEAIAPELKKQGIELEIITLMDYYLPNRLVDEKQADANFFQHLPFLEIQADEQHLNLEVLGKVHIEPMGVYAKNLKSKENFYHKTLALPSDPSNQGRALLLLEASGIITLKKGSNPSILDIESNPYDLQWIEVDGAILPRMYDDVDLAVIPTNFALQIGLVPTKDALFLEDGNSPYANIVVAHPDSDKKEALKLLMEALESETMKSFLKEHYKGAILPAKGS